MIQDKAEVIRSFKKQLARDIFWCKKKLAESNVAIYYWNRMDAPVAIALLERRMKKVEAELFNKRWILKRLNRYC